MITNAPSLIPPEFDWQYYSTIVNRSCGLDDHEDAYFQHFKKIGCASGIPGSRGSDQGFFVRLIRHLQPSAVLEIGPGSSPKIVGEGVYYFDVKSREQLCERYPDRGEYIPETIHYVQKDGDLSVVNRKFDIVFSCHMIEHVPDLVSHLQQVSQLLKPGGYYFLVIPNKKYCFDYFKPETTSADVISTHVLNTGVNFALTRSFLLEKLCRAHNDPLRHWNGDHGQPSCDVSGIMDIAQDHAIDRLASIFKSGFHRWFFDEYKLRNVLSDLYELDLIRLKAVSIYNTQYGSMSFNAILQLQT